MVSTKAQEGQEDGAFAVLLPGLSQNSLYRRQLTNDPCTRSVLQECNLRNNVSGTIFPLQVGFPGS